MIKAAILSIFPLTIKASSEGNTPLYTRVPLPPHLSDLCGSPVLSLDGEGGAAREDVEGGTAGEDGAAGTPEFTLREARGAPLGYVLQQEGGAAAQLAPLTPPTPPVQPRAHHLPPPPPPVSVTPPLVPAHLSPSPPAIATALPVAPPRTLSRGAIHDVVPAMERLQLDDLPSARGTDEDDSSRPHSRSTRSRSASTSARRGDTLRRMGRGFAKKITSRRKRSAATINFSGTAETIVPVIENTLRRQKESSIPIISRSFFKEVAFYTQNPNFGYTKGSDILKLLISNLKVSQYEVIAKILLADSDRQDQDTLVMEVLNRMLPRQMDLILFAASNDRNPNRYQKIGRWLAGMENEQIANILSRLYNYKAKDYAKAIGGILLSFVDMPKANAILGSLLDKINGSMKPSPFMTEIFTPYKESHYVGIAQLLKNRNVDDVAKIMYRFALQSSGDWTLSGQILLAIEDLAVAVSIMNSILAEYGRYSAGLMLISRKNDYIGAIPMHSLSPLRRRLRFRSGGNPNPHPNPHASAPVLTIPPVTSPTLTVRPAAFHALTGSTESISPDEAAAVGALSSDHSSVLASPRGFEALTRVTSGHRGGISPIAVTGPTPMTSPRRTAPLTVMEQDNRALEILLRLAVDQVRGILGESYTKEDYKKINRMLLTIPVDLVNFQRLIDILEGVDNVNLCKILLCKPSLRIGQIILALNDKRIKLPGDTRLRRTTKAAQLLVDFYNSGDHAEQLSKIIPVLSILEVRTQSGALWKELHRLLGMETTLEWWNGFMPSEDRLIQTASADGIRSITDFMTALTTTDAPTAAGVLSMKNISADELSNLLTALIGRLDITQLSLEITGEQSLDQSLALK